MNINHISSYISRGLFIIFREILLGLLVQGCLSVRMAYIVLSKGSNHQNKLIKTLRSFSTILILRVVMQSALTTFLDDVYDSILCNQAFMPYYKKFLI